MFDISKMFEAGMFVYMYLLILLLIVLEFWVRKKMNLGTIIPTPASWVARAATVTRTTLLFFALPLLCVEIWFVVMYSLIFISPSPFFIILYYLKVIMFALWVSLVLLKAFFEYKYLSVKSAVVTMIFAVPMIGLLYIIYTTTF